MPHVELASDLSVQGTKKTINTARDYAKSAQDLKDKALSSTPDPKHVLKYLRSAAQSYGAAIPGLGYIIDQTCALTQYR